MLEKSPHVLGSRRFDVSGYFDSIGVCPAESCVVYKDGEIAIANKSEFVFRICSAIHYTYSLCNQVQIFTFQHWFEKKVFP